MPPNVFLLSQKCIRIVSDQGSAPCPVETAYNTT